MRCLYADYARRGVKPLTLNLLVQYLVLLIILCIETESWHRGITKAEVTSKIYVIVIKILAILSTKNKTFMTKQSTYPFVHLVEDWLMTVWGQCLAERQRHTQRNITNPDFLFSCFSILFYSSCTKVLSKCQDVVWSRQSSYVTVHKLYSRNGGWSNETYFPEQTPFIHLHVFSTAGEHTSLVVLGSVGTHTAVTHWAFLQQARSFIQHLQFNSSDRCSLCEILTVTFDENAKPIFKLFYAFIGFKEKKQSWD